VHGNIVYDHIGEGAYDETEAKIVELLEELYESKGERVSISTESGGAQVPKAFERLPGGSTPEIYFGSRRNEYLENGTRGKVGIQSFVLPENLISDKLYLGGTWDIAEQSAYGKKGSMIALAYQASKVFMVLGSEASARVEITQDGAYLSKENAGADVLFDGEVSYIDVQQERLYQIISEDAPGSHVFKLEVQEGELEAFTFTFG
jgi:hypothetical protein